VALPDLGVPEIKVKVDTGAKTSAIHAFDVKERTIDGVKHVEFVLHPVPRRKRPQVKCLAEIKEKRKVRSSNGMWERRYVITTTLAIGDKSWPIELTLTNRDQMGFRMLLGREAMKRQLVVDPAKSYHAPKGRMTS
jgi:hypothetical protein